VKGSKPFEEFYLGAQRNANEDQSADSAK